MSYRIAGIDVHKAVLVVVTADIESEGSYQFERRKFGAMPTGLHELATWFLEHGVQEVVMESTAQYWRPVWHALEQYWQAECRRRADNPHTGVLHLAQAQSNRAPRGRKTDFADSERLVKRLVAQELRLSFVPDREQRLWRAVSRRKLQLTRDRARLLNQVEAFLQEAHIKLSNVVSDLFGVSAVRMLRALAKGEREVGKLASLAHGTLRATKAELENALGACADLSDVYRRILGLHLQHMDLLDAQIESLGKELSGLLANHQNAVVRLAGIPGFGTDSAQQFIAEVGDTAAAFPTPKQFTSWIGSCAGNNESAGVSHGSSSPHGNRNLRRLLDLIAHAAIKMQGCV